MMNDGLLMALGSIIIHYMVLVWFMLEEQSIMQEMQLGEELREAQLPFDCVFIIIIIKYLSLKVLFRTEKHKVFDCDFDGTMSNLPTTKYLFHFYSFISFLFSFFFFLFSFFFSFFFFYFFKSFDQNTTD
jgi:hypothetical protein